MADISTFPTFNPGDTGNAVNTATFTAGATITAGMVVAFATTGVSSTVHPAKKGTTGQVIGVAMYGAASAAKVTVALVGSIVQVANADDTTGIDAGDWVEANDNAVTGTVSTVLLSGSTEEEAANYNIVGIALDDIAGGAYGRVLISPVLDSKRV